MNDGGPDLQPRATVTARRVGDPRRRRRRLMIVVVALLSLGFLAFGADWIRYRANHVHETDARIVADLTVIASRVAGPIVELAFEEGQQVVKGQLLGRIDARDAELRVAELSAELAGNAAERARLAAQIDMIGQRTQSRIESERSQTQALQAVLAARTSELALAREEFQRGESLFNSKVTSQRDWDRVRFTFFLAQHAHARAQADVAASRAKQAEIETEALEIGMLQQAIERLRHQEAEVAARLERAKTDVEDRSVRSPIDGIVDRRFVRFGEYVDAGQRIALIHDPKDVRIEANIRETQVGRLKVGQKVEIKVDAHPDHAVVGRVTRIGSSATSSFALLPTPNPSGNFTKVTQRLPVRIDLETNGLRLAPGMMVEVVIDVVDR